MCFKLGPYLKEVQIYTLQLFFLMQVQLLAVFYFLIKYLCIYGLLPMVCHFFEFKISEKTIFISSYKLFSGDYILQLSIFYSKCSTDPNRPLMVPSSINECWSMDFMHDQLQSGRNYRLLNVIAHFNREGLGIKVDLSLPSQRVIRALE